MMNYVLDHIPHFNDLFLVRNPLSSYFSNAWPTCTSAPTCRSKEPTNRVSTAAHSGSPISILNDDVLLNIFYLYRLGIHDTDGDEDVEPIKFAWIWKRQRWWYKLAHVSRLWRCIVLASPSKLDLHLICTHEVPVEDMLTHSPSLPLIVLYNCEETPKHEEEASLLLALSHHDRVRRIALWTPASDLEKFMLAMDKEFPILECLSMCWTENSDLVLPKKFQSPSLRQMCLWGVVLPIRSPSALPSTGGLVYLWLSGIPESIHLSPHEIHMQLSFMPQLVSLGILFEYPLDRNVVGSPIMTPVTLPNLFVIVFKGERAYLESFLTGIRAPDLGCLWVVFYPQLDFPVPHLLQFIQSTKSLTFKHFKLVFSGDSIWFAFDPYPESEESLPVYCWVIECDHLGQHVASAVQIFGALSPILSVVEKITFSYTTDPQPAQLHDIDRIQLRKLLGSFSGVKTLHVQNDFVGLVSWSLLSEDGEPPLELLPNLEEITYSGSDARDVLMPFINERQAAGHPVTVRLV